MNYTPTRFYVKIDVPTSKALGRVAEKRGCDDPRHVGAALIRERLVALGELPAVSLDRASPCPRCNSSTVPHQVPTMLGINMRWCENCQEPVQHQPNLEEKQ